MLSVHNILSVIVPTNSNFFISKPKFDIVVPPYVLHSFIYVLLVPNFHEANNHYLHFLLLVRQRTLHIIDFYVQIIRDHTYFIKMSYHSLPKNLFINKNQVEINKNLLLNDKFHVKLKR